MPHIETEASDTKPVTTQAQGFRNITAGPLIRRAGDVVGLQEAYDELHALDGRIDNISNITEIENTLARLNRTIDDFNNTFAQISSGGQAAVFANAGSDLIQVDTIRFQKIEDNHNSTRLARLAGEGAFVSTGMSSVEFGEGYTRRNVPIGVWDGSEDIPSGALENNIDGSGTPSYNVIRSGADDKLQTFAGSELAILDATIGYAVPGVFTPHLLVCNVSVINRGPLSQDFWTAIGAPAPTEQFGEGNNVSLPRMALRFRDISYGNVERALPTANVQLTAAHEPFMLREGIYEMRTQNVYNESERIGYSVLDAQPGLSQNRAVLRTGTFDLNRMPDGPIANINSFGTTEVRLIYDTFAALRGITIDLLVEAKNTVDANILYTRPFNNVFILTTDFEIAAHQSLFPRRPPLFSSYNDAIASAGRAAVFAEDDTPSYALPAIGQPLLLPYRLIGRRFFTD